MPAKLPQYAGAGERYIESQSPARILVYTLAMTMLVGAPIVGFVVWDELSESNAEDLLDLRHALLDAGS